MSLLEDLNRETNLRNAEECRNSAQEHMVELERLRIENEKFKTPEYAKFWERKKEQVLKLRTSKSLLSIP
jgi:hypothetical protein